MSKPAPLSGNLASEVERQRAEIAELRGWVRQYRLFAQNTLNVIFMLDLETGRIVYVNGAVNRAIVLLTRYLPEWLVMGVLTRVARTFRKV